MSEKSNVATVAGIISGAVVAVSAILGPVTSAMTAEQDRQFALAEHQAKMKLQFIQMVMDTKGDPSGREDVLHYYSNVLEDESVKNWAAAKLEEVGKYNEALELVQELEAKLAEAEARLATAENPDEIRKLVGDAEAAEKELIQARVAQGVAARALDVADPETVGSAELPIRMTVRPFGKDQRGTPIWTVRISLVGAEEFFDGIQEVEYFISGGTPEKKVRTDRGDDFALEYGATICKPAIPITVRGKDGSAARRVFNMCRHPEWLNRKRMLVSATPTRDEPAK